MFVPEFSDLLKEAEKYTFTYSIRMSLKPEGCYVRGMSFDSCQLYWRHWIIKTNDTVVSDINGEAVIGQVAILICVRRVLLCTFTYKPFVVSTVSPFTSRGERVCL